MIEWLKNNFMIVLYILIAIVYVIIAIIGAVKNKKISTFKDLIEFVPIMINDAEKLALTGNQKFFYVMREIEAICKKLNHKFDANYFDELIESILSTPQKKNKDF